MIVIANEFCLNYFSFVLSNPLSYQQRVSVAKGYELWSREELLLCNPSKLLCCHVSVHLFCCRLLCQVSLNVRVWADNPRARFCVWGAHGLLTAVVALSAEQCTRRCSSRNSVVIVAETNCRDFFVLLSQYFKVIFVGFSRMFLQHERQISLQWK